MTRPVFLSGRVYGRLRVLGRAPNDRHNKSRWFCVCSCGSFVVVGGAGLKKGDTTSCGCFRRDTAGDACRINLEGRSWGKLTIGKLVNVQRRKKWEVYCSCGNVTYLASKDCTPNRYTSCGCLKGAPRIDNKSSIIKRRYISYRQNAKKKGREFNLSLEQFSTLVTSPCFYCGEIDSRDQSRGSRMQGKNKDFYKKEEVNGVDRVDSTLGYTETNSVPCCYMCNKMKMEFTQESFLSKIKQINAYCRRE